MTGTRVRLCQVLFINLGNMAIFSNTFEEDIPKEVLSLGKVLLFTDRIHEAIDGSFMLNVILHFLAPFVSPEFSSF